ncbi:MAG TPA: AarF/UbiB family protein, partial [Polyangia bacterium]
MVRATLTNSRLLLRALTILVLFLVQGLHWFAGWVWLVVSFAGRKRRKAWFGRCVLDLFRRLGATFIKVGQIMSTRPDLLPEYITHALEHLQDDVGPFPFAQVVRTIEEDLRKPLHEIFAEFSPVPLASASVSQVHKARLPDGRVVAVKVRRPNLVELCTFDLAVMRTVAHWLGKLPPLEPLEPESAVEEFGRAVFAQLDFF